MKAIIIDDEKRARSLLSNILADWCPQVTAVWEAANLREGGDLIREKEPQIVFLDVEMPQQLGVEIFDYFDRDEIDFDIAFTTAYSDYAVTAFEMNAVAYLLKPLRPKKVKEGVERIHQRFDRDSIRRKLEALDQSLRNQGFQKIGLPVSDGILFVELDAVLHLEADGCYTKVHTSTYGSRVVSKPLRFFDQMLQSQQHFYRPLRSHIVNLHFLKQYMRKDGTYIVLENDHIIPISKDKRDEFMELVSSIG